MFLSEHEIRQRLKKGDFVIDPPPDESQFSGLGIDLRLGTQFIDIPPKDDIDIVDTQNPLISQSSTARTVPLGKGHAIYPRTTLVTTTLDYVHMPLDLAGLLFAKSYLERIGLSVTTTTVDPGFRGKLTFALRNVNSVPILVYAGVRLVRLCLVSVSGVVSPAYTNEQLVDRSEIESLKATLEEAAPRRSSAAASTQSLANRLEEVLAAEGTKKGKALEDLITDLFTSLEGLRIMKRNARLRAEELDLVIKNNLNTGFWRIAGSPLIVECKNWSGKVGAREISVLVDKLQALSPDAKAGILVAINGITGDHYSDAMLKIREARQRGRYILVLEGKDLKDLVIGDSLAQVIEAKYDAMMLL